MSSNSTNNKTIAKNSIFLYVRTFVSIFVTLYTSRVFLNQLGIEDYGIYSLVGGVVSIFAMLTQFMTGATQRFLSAEIGKGDISQMNKILNISITIHLLIGVLLIAVGEVVGMILINNYLDIPDGKESITKIVYHFSLLASFVSVLGIPYNGFIIARERMSFFAWITIADVVMKLIITLSLVLVSQKLMYYSALYLFTTVIITFAYYYYCKRKLELPEYKYYGYKGNDEYKQMLSYSGWSFVGYLASSTREQGMSVLLNMFFGVLLNAAMGVVNQVYAVFSRMFLNLHAAFRPQIMQNAATDKSRYDNLLNICTFYTIILMGLLCTPMIVGCNSILTIWLGMVPDFAVLFVQLMVIKVLIASVTQSFNITIEAFAKLKASMIASIIISVIVLIVTYSMLKMGLHPAWAIIMLIISEIGYLLFRAYYSAKHGLCDILGLVSYCWKAVLMVVVFCSAAFVISGYMDSHLKSILTMVMTMTVYCIATLLIMKKNQRNILFGKIKAVLHIKQ